MQVASVKLHNVISVNLVHSVLLAQSTQPPAVRAASLKLRAVRCVLDALKARFNAVRAQLLVKAALLASHALLGAVYRFLQGVLSLGLILVVSSPFVSLAPPPQHTLFELPRAYARCPSGTFVSGNFTSEEDCAVCGIGFECLGGESQPRLCRKGTISPHQGMGACEKCDPGKFQEEEGATSCMPCSPGSICPPGASAPLPCRKGSYSTAIDISDQSQCLPCPPGSACSTGSVVPIPCSPGSVAVTFRSFECTFCNGGTFQASANQTACDACKPGYYCPSGSAAALPCPGGTRMDLTMTMRTEADCISCRSGTFCPIGSASETLCSAGSINPIQGQQECTKCMPGKFQDDAGTTACRPCLTGYFCPLGSAAAIPCGEGTFSERTNLSHREQCEVSPAGFSSGIGSTVPAPCTAGSYTRVEGSGKCQTCPSGRYQPTLAATACTGCSSGHWCSADVQIPCSENTYGPNLLAHVVTNCTRCPERTSTLGRSGVSSFAACACMPGFFLAPEGRDTSNDPACKERCCTCPIGTDCSSGDVTLALLPIKKGYFRLSRETNDVGASPNLHASPSSSCVPARFILLWVPACRSPMLILYLTFHR